MFWYGQGCVLEGLVDVKITMTLYNQNTTKSQMTSKRGDDAEIMNIPW